jgi:hypothetical protein
MKPSALEKTLLASSPLLVFLVAGAFVLFPGKGVPPGHKYIFGGITLVIGLIAAAALRSYLVQLTKLSSRKALTTGITLLLVATALGASYAALFEYCVVSDPREFTIYYPMWASGELEQGIREKGNRRALTAAYGQGTLIRLVKQMPGYPLPIIATSGVLLILLQSSFLAITSACAIFSSRISTEISDLTDIDQRDRDKVRVLFLAANPDDTDPLRLDHELRAIREKIRLSEFRDKFDFRTEWAVRVGDLQGFLLQHRPNIVHFSGHGSSAGEIVLESPTGASHPVSNRALTDLFSILDPKVSCVVLNACFSEAQAQAISKHVDYVVGMSIEVGDLAAIGFAAAFYQAIGYGEDMETAFKLACNQIDLEGLGEQDTPKLISRMSS